MQDAGAASPGLLALFGAVALASLATWMWILGRWRARRPLVEFEPRRPVPWGLADATLILGMWIILPGVFYGLCLTLTRTEPARIEWPKSAEGLRVLMMATLLGNLLSVVLGTAWLWFGRGARARDLGLSARLLAGDLWLGVVAFAAVAVPVYVIQSVLVQFMPSEHPLVQLLHESDDAATAVLALLTAAVAAPLGEEFLFRLVLQGALERAEIQAFPATDENQSTETAGLGTDAIAGGVNLSAAFAENLPADRVDAVGAEVENPYASPQAVVLPSQIGLNSAADAVQTGESDTARVRKWGLPLGVWPILITSTLFALMHWRHGPDPIPLFVLAVVLGYLYRQTHRIVPSIVVHFLLNSCSLAALWLQGRGPQ